MCPLTFFRPNQPRPLSDLHRFNLKVRPQEENSLLSLVVLPRLQHQARMGCLSLVRILSAVLSELLRFACYFLPNHLSAPLNSISQFQANKYPFSHIQRHEWLS